MLPKVIMELKTYWFCYLLCSRFFYSCILGYVIQILSFGAFLSLATGNPAKFALIYSFGNILALAA